MAEEENTDTPKGGSKKKLILIIIIAVVLLSAGAAAYFLLAGDNSEAEAEQVEQQKSTESIEKREETTYIAMPRPFVFNVMEGKRDRLVQIKVQLMVHGRGNALRAKKHIPLLEGTLVQVFGAATAEQLRSPVGKAQLREYSLQALNEATSKVENKELIIKVLFTGFVLQ